MISNVIILGRSTFAFGPKLVRMILASCLIGIGQTIAAPRLETEQTKLQLQLVAATCDRALVRTLDSNIRQNVLRRREKGGGGGGGGEGGEAETEAEAEKQTH
jgi:hypothetical protein